MSATWLTNGGSDVMIGEAAAPEDPPDAEPLLD